MAAEKTPDLADAADGMLLLRSKLDLKGSEELVRELQARRGRDLTLDASDVDLLGAHAVQTLLVAAQTWRSDGHCLAVTDLSDAAVEHLGLMGLEQSVFDDERTG